MASPIALRRGSSSSAGRSPQPPPPPPPQPAIASAAAAKRAGSFTTTVDEAHLQRVTTTSSPVNINSTTQPDDVPIHPTLLQPRVAVVLNVPPPWHPWLFTLRLVSVLPAVWWGLPSLLQLLIRLLPNQDFVLVSKSGVEDDATRELYSLTETGLATIWCFASGYLSFFFTDCLMSRWLINYAPQATMVRLLTINACNAYITAGVLSFAGGFRDPRLLLPGWIGIATTLTVMYHITHQKINIRKETSTSINVFSIASFISMVTLLAQLYINTPDYPTMPLITWCCKAWEELSHFIAQVQSRVAPDHVDI